MKLLDKVLWFSLVVVQGVFCLLLFTVAYDEQTASYVAPPIGVRDITGTTPMTAEEQKQLQDNFRLLLGYNKQLFQHTHALAKEYSLALGCMLLLSLVLEVTLLWRTLRTNRTEVRSCNPTFPPPGVPNP